MPGRAMGQGEGQAGAKGIRSYLEDGVYGRKAPHGGHSDDLRHQVSPQQVRLQLVHLEVSAADPAFGQEPGHRGIRGQEERRWGGSHAWQLELERGAESGDECQAPTDPLTPPSRLSSAHLATAGPCSLCSSPASQTRSAQPPPHKMPVAETAPPLRPHFPFGPAA